ncbi:MAG TPA: DnaB-like helicase C-terminal domain-containing protein [Anaerolineae bacterium]|nr:DnaB-like helicase C-terminal domain-containing protein [Anaerolineae bacterium]
MDKLQAVVLRALLSRTGWTQYGEVITPDIITNANVQAVHTHIRALHERGEEDISTEALRLVIQASHPQGSARAQELCDVVSHMEEAQEVPDDIIQDAVKKFARRELLSQAATQIASHIGDDEIDVLSVQTLVARALDLGESVNGQVVDALESPLPGEVDCRPGIAALGLGDQLDFVLGGGVAEGELLCIVAPPARGKTSYLIAIGAAAAAHGRNVLHITLEISEARVRQRLDQAWTGMKVPNMIANPRTVVHARQKVKDTGGTVWVKDWSYQDGGTTPADVKALVRQMRSRGITIDMVVIDYLELMSPNRTGNFSRREMRHVYGQQIKEIRAVAVGLGVPICTAWQINRAGMSLDTVTMEHVSECYDINKHADIILGLNQSDGEAENNQMRIGVLKQRNGTARPQIHVKSDLDRCQIRALKEVEPDDDPIDATAEDAAVPGVQ